MPKSNATLDSTGKRKSFRRLVSRFAEKTSMQGVPYINMAKLWWAKVIWSILLLAAITVMFLHLWFLFDQWYSYPKATQISLGFDHLPLPQVTICNTNVMHKGRFDKFNGAKQLKLLVQDLRPTNLVPDQFDDEQDVTSEGTTAMGSGGVTTQGQGGPTTPRPRTVTTQGSEGATTGGSGGVTTQGSGGATTRDSGRSRGPRTTKETVPLTSRQRNINRTQATEQTTKANIRNKRSVGTYQGLNVSNYIDDLYEEEAEDGDFDSEYDEFTLLQQVFSELFMDLKVAERRYLGHNINDMLVDCTFNGRKCNANMFKIHQTSQYGNCWTVSSKKFRVKNAGSTSGLSLVLFLESNEYLKGITTGFGTRVVLQERNTYPFPADDGVFIPASMETDIGLKMVRVSRLGGDFGSCDDGTAFQSNYNLTYTRRACQTFCLDSSVIKTCSCFDEQSEEYALSRNSSLKVCRSREEMKCLTQVKRSLAKQESPCNCDKPCNKNGAICMRAIWTFISNTEISYRKTLSMRQWPNDDYARVLIQWVCNQDPVSCSKLRNLRSDSRFLSNNFLKLNIYYEDLNFENITETAQIELQQFLSDIGGAFGLWIGLSVLSMCELFQLFIELIDYAFHRSTGRRRTGGEKTRQQQGNRLKDFDDVSPDDRENKNDYNSPHNMWSRDRKHNNGHRDRNIDHLHPYDKISDDRRRYSDIPDGRRGHSDTEFMNRSPMNSRHHVPRDDRHGGYEGRGQWYR